VAHSGVLLVQASLERPGRPRPRHIIRTPRSCSWYRNSESSYSPHQPNQLREVQALGQFAKFQGDPLIDVYTPFSEQDVDALYHPTPVGLPILGRYGEPGPVCR
jgi:hypothetical protein